MIKFLIFYAPAPLKNLARRLGLDTLLTQHLTKHQAELIFQQLWAKQLKNHNLKTLVTNYWTKYRHLKTIKQLTQPTKTTKILDIGCGISTILYSLPGKLYGIDPLADHYHKLLPYPKHFHIQSTTAESLPYKNKFFNIIFCSNTLDHTNNPQAVLTQIHRTLKKTGHLILINQVFPKSIKRDPAHPHTFTKKQLLELVKPHFNIIFQKTTQAPSQKQFLNNQLNSPQTSLTLILTPKD